jgi:deazaflavin-dependent oxidoreductase (nitroreductase family)
MSDFNAGVIADFIANNGKVGPPFEGAPLLLLTTTGAKSGEPRVTPLVYRTDGNRILIFASYAGADKHPAWFHNILANPIVNVQVGDGTTIDSYQAAAVVIEGAERDELYAAQATDMPGFAEYQEKTSRVIPVVALNREP